MGGRIGPREIIVFGLVRPLLGVEIMAAMGKLKTPKPRRRRLAVLGSDDGALRNFLSDILRDRPIEIDWGGVTGAAPDLVLAIVGQRDATVVVASARALAGGAPVIALAAMRDEQLTRKVLAAGALACFALDAPLIWLFKGIDAHLG